METHRAATTIQTGWRTLRRRLGLRSKAARYEGMIMLLRAAGMVREPAPPPPMRCWASADVEREWRRQLAGRAPARSRPATTTVSAESSAAAAAVSYPGGIGEKETADALARGAVQLQVLQKLHATLSQMPATETLAVGTLLPLTRTLAATLGEQQRLLQRDKASLRSDVEQRTAAAAAASARAVARLRAKLLAAERRAEALQAELRRGEAHLRTARRELVTRGGGTLPPLDDDGDDGDGLEHHHARRPAAHTAHTATAAGATPHAGVAAHGRPRRMSAEEYAASLEVLETRARPLPPSEEAGEEGAPPPLPLTTLQAPQMLEELRLVLEEELWRATDLFRAWDVRRTGLLLPEDVALGLQTLGLAVSAVQLSALFEHYAPKELGIDIRAFTRMLRREGSMASPPDATHAGGGGAGVGGGGGHHRPHFSSLSRTAEWREAHEAELGRAATAMHATMHAPPHIAELAPSPRVPRPPPTPPPQQPPPPPTTTTATTIRTPSQQPPRAPRARSPPRGHPHAQPTGAEAAAAAGGDPSRLPTAAAPVMTTAVAAPQVSTPVRVSSGGVSWRQPSLPTGSAALAASVRAAFELMDTSGNGRLSRAEVIKAARSNPKVRQLLDLPATIRQEDGSRDRFERVFQAMDQDDSKEVDLEEFARFVAQLQRAASAASSAATPRGGDTYGAPASAGARRVSPSMASYDRLPACASLLRRDASEPSQPPQPPAQARAQPPPPRPQPPPPVPTTRANTAPMPFATPATAPSDRGGGGGLGRGQSQLDLLQQRLREQSQASRAAAVAATAAAAPPPPSPSTAVHGGPSANDYAPRFDQGRGEAYSLAPTPPHHLVHMPTYGWLTKAAQGAWEEAEGPAASAAAATAGEGPPTPTNPYAFSISADREAARAARGWAAPTTPATPRYY